MNMIALVLLTLAPSVQLGCTHKFTLDATFSEVCTAVHTSAKIQEAIDEYEPYFISYARHIEQGYAICQVKTHHIQTVREVSLKIEIWAGDLTIVQLQSSGTILGPRFKRALARPIVLGQFKRGMKTIERHLREELEGEADEEVEGEAPN